MTKQSAIQSQASPADTSRAVKADVEGRAGPTQPNPLDVSTQVFTNLLLPFSTVQPTFIYWLGLGAGH